MLKSEFDKRIRLDNKNEGESIEDQWRIIEDSIQNAVEKVLGYGKRVPKKEWTTSQNCVIEERRPAKRKTQKYTETYAK
jgi:hypothetical protein